MDELPWCEPEVRAGRSAERILIRQASEVDPLLGPEERRQATVLSLMLSRARDAARAGERDAPRLTAAIQDHIKSTPLAVLDYVGVCAAETFEPLCEIGGKAVAVVAASFDSTRLIDNTILEA